jgi:flagella basal body P-ring formation protein FlgA
MNVLFILALLLPGGSPPADWRDEAVRTVEDAIREGMTMAPEDYQIELRGVAVSPAESCSGAMEIRVPPEPLPVFRGNISVPVELVCSGRTLARGIVSVKVRTFHRVAVCTAPLGRHAVPGPETVAFQRVETTAMPQDFVTGRPDWSGLWTTRMLSGGTVLRSGMLETRPLIQGGTPVMLRVHSGLATVSVQAIAREDGRLNEWIAVQQQQSRRNIQARVVGPGAVEITLE